MSTDPLLSWFGGKSWLLEEDWSYKLPDGLALFLTVPAGFIFDLASIPRILWIVPGFAPFELSTAAPLIHDFIYDHKGMVPMGTVTPYHRTFKRSDADRYFRLIMKEEGVWGWRRTVAWLAVRFGGFFSWRTL